MISQVKSVLIGLTKEFGGDETSSALSYGLSLAQAAGAHATVQAVSLRLQLANAWLSSYTDGLVNAENRRLHALAEAAAQSSQGNAEGLGVNATVCAQALDYHNLLSSFTTLARLNDLSVIDAETEALHLDRDVIEALLTQTGRPVLVTPPGWDTFRCERVVIAWDGSARAARAVNDALSFLRAAEAVQVVAVTGEKDLPEEVRGAELAPHLARHGVRVEVSNPTARGGDVAQTLRDTATLFRADMLVMGGYVHSRLREYLLGGVTQSLLKSAPVPLLMSY